MLRRMMTNFKASCVLTKFHYWDISRYRLVKNFHEGIVCKNNDSITILLTVSHLNST